MEELINYLLKASLAIAIFYSVYWLFLRRETLFRTNRFFLIVSLILSMVLPFMGFRYTSYISSDSANLFTEINKNFQSLSEISLSADSLHTGFSWQNVILAVYLTGLAIFFLRIIWQCVDLLILIGKNGISRTNEMNIVCNNKYGLPFSFFNIVFINPKFHYGTDLTNILTHEKVHIRENHWFDLLVVELLTTIFWFNPFVWLFERSIKQNHEYLADEGVLAQGLSVGRYQAILINQLMGMQIIGITNNLNYSLNKKRINMMTKSKSPKGRVFKLLWTLPAIALLIMAFAKPDFETSKPIPRNPIQNMVNETMQFTGKIVDGSGSPLEGASIVIYGGTTGTTSDIDGLFTLKMDRSDQIVISYVGFVSQKWSGSEISYKLEKTSNKIVRFSLVVGEIKLDIDEILANPDKYKEFDTPDNQVGDEKYVIIEQLPSYPGGLYEFAKEIKEKIRAKKPSGKINVDFTVDENGTMKSVLGSDYWSGSDIEMIWQNLKKWTPGKQKGKAVPVNYNITLNQ